MAVNPLEKAIRTQIEKHPTSEQAIEALAILQSYQKTRQQIESVFTNFMEGTRTKQVNQYFEIRRLLEAFDIKFPRSLKSQSTDVKAFPMEWKGDRSAVLYWAIGDGWSVGHKDFDKDLTGEWDGFDLEDTLQANGYSFTEYEDD